MESIPHHWSNCLDYAALSDVGMRRVNNEDNLAVALATNQENWRQKGHLFLVADGMGFHAAGEMASKLAADNVPLNYQKSTQGPVAQALLKAVQDANDLIRRRGETHDEFRGMGTTCTTMLLTEQGVVVAHIGDSRCYRLRGNLLEQLTFDHSMVWEMSAAGTLPAAQVAQYVPKNIITRAMGRDWTVQVDLEGPFPVHVGDTYLLCTDGLSGQVTDQEMGAIMSCLPPARAARLLVDLANLRGGPDNITLIVARVLGPQTVRGTVVEAPAAASQTGDQGQVHPLTWTALGLSTLIALLMAMLEYWGAVLASLVAAAVAGIVAWLQRSLPGGAQPGAMSGAPLGRGPYVRGEAAADAEFVGRLATTVMELREAAVAGNWVLDWASFNAYQDQGAQAAAEGDLAQAVRDYGEAICFMMAELRQQNIRQPNGQPGQTPPAAASDDTDFETA